MADLQTILTLSVKKILSSLIKTLLRNGFSYGDFDRLARQCFVDVAYQQPMAEGKKQTVSNVSIITGLNRKEVKKLHEIETPLSHEKVLQRNRCVRVLGGWTHDADFLNEINNPLDLELEGPSSFQALVKKYSGDIPVVAMQKALLKSGNIKMIDKAVRLVKVNYLPSNDPIDKLSILGTDVSELLDTIHHNIISNTLRFQRKASNDKIDLSALPAIAGYMELKGQEFLEEADQFLSEHENLENPEKQCSVSIGAYYHEAIKGDKK